MAKRFSTREFGLLMAPVLLVGAVGFWVSKRPVGDGKPRVTFRIEKPTTLETFEGYAGTFVAEFPMGNVDLTQCTRYVELQPPLKSGLPKRIVWKDSAAGISALSGHLFKFRDFPPGELYFGFDGVFTPWDAGGTKPPISVNKKWKINRAQIKAPNLAALPHKPLITLREIKIVKLPISYIPSVTGKAVFQLEGASMGAETSIEASFSNPHGGLTSALKSPALTPKTPRQREIELTVDKISGAKTQRITGRVSADNRWPLGFEIEPFDFKTAKVGQKLKFKQFPVALPKP